MGGASAQYGAMLDAALVKARQDAIAEKGREQGNAHVMVEYFAIDSVIRGHDLLETWVGLNDVKKNPFPRKS